jgi:two-component system sensor histidine kinase QseC
VRHAAATIRALVGAIRVAPNGADVERSLVGIDDSARAITQMIRLPENLTDPLPVRVDQLAEIAARRAQVVSSCEIDVRAERAVVSVSEIDFHRLLTNLLDNACRAAGPSGRVSVEVLQEGPSIVLHVSDSGPGFGAFVARDGVGLSIVEAVTRGLGGRITFGRSALGGVRVSVELPRSQELGMLSETVDRQQGEALA